MRLDIIRIGTSKYFFLYLIFSIFFVTYIFFNPNSINLELVFLAVLILSFPIGYLALIPFRKHLVMPFLGIIPVTISLGFILNYLWVFALSPFTLQPLLFVVPFIISVTTIFYFRLSGFFIEEGNQNTSVEPSHNNLVLNQSESRKWISLFFVFIIPVILYIVLVNNYAELNPNLIIVGDWNYHTTLIKTILQQDHLSLFLEDGGLVGYPIGWHVATAGFANFFKLQPLQMGFLLLTVLSFLLFGVLMSAAFLVIRSIWITIGAMTAYFFVNMSSPFTFVYGGFLAGFGPFLLGSLCAITTLFFLLLIKNKNNYSFFLLLLLLLIGTGVAYPPMTIYLSIWIGLFVLFNFRRIKAYKFKSAKKVFNVLKIKQFNILHLILIALVIGIVSGQLYYLPANIIKSSSPTGDYYFSHGHTYYTDLAIKNFIIILVVVSMVNLFYFKESRFFTLIIFSSIIVATLATNLSNLVVYFTPHRINFFLVVFTWILLGLCIKQGEVFISSRYYNNKFRLLIKNKPFTIIFFLISLIVFIPSIVNVANMESFQYEIIFR